MVLMTIGGFIFGFCSNKTESIGKGTTTEGRTKHGQHTQRYIRNPGKLSLYRKFSIKHL